jgi:hypothetical protein
MKRPLVLSALLFLLPVLLGSPAGAQTRISGPAFTTAPDDGRIRVSPALQLSISSVPPLACTSAARGAIALDSRAHLCLCDGQCWKLANTDEACAWTSTAR